MVYKVLTTWEAKRVTLALQKESRDWTSQDRWRGFANPRSYASIFIDLAFGTFFIVTLCQFIGHVMGDTRTITERLLMVVGFIMMVIVGGILITSVDVVPDALYDNAIILGVLAFVAGVLFLTDAGTKCQRKKKPKPVVKMKREIEIVPKVEEKKEEPAPVQPKEEKKEEKKEEPVVKTNGIKSVEIRIKDPPKNWPLYGQRSKTLTEIETLAEAERVDRMLQNLPDPEQEPVLLESRRQTASVQPSPIRHTSSFYIGGPFSWRRLNDQNKQ